MRCVNLVAYRFSSFYRYREKKTKFVLFNPSLDFNASKPRWENRQILLSALNRGRSRTNASARIR